MQRLITASFLLFLGENGVTKVQEFFQKIPQPARWSNWGEWGDCVLPEFTSGELDGTKTRPRVCVNRVQITLCFLINI